MTTFPIDLSAYKRISLDVSNPTLTNEQKTGFLQYDVAVRDLVMACGSFVLARLAEVRAESPEHSAAPTQTLRTNAV